MMEEVEKREKRKGDKDTRKGKQKWGEHISTKQKEPVVAERVEEKRKKGKKGKTRTTLNPFKMAWHSHATRLSSCFPLYF